MNIRRKSTCANAPSTSKFAKFMQLGSPARLWLEEEYILLRIFGRQQSRAMDGFAACKNVCDDGFQ
jgi:hypothetical protein